MRNEVIEAAFRGISIEPESLQDAEHIYKYLGCDPEITRYTGWNPYQTLQATIEKIERDMDTDDGSYSWVIKKDGVFIGTIGAYDYKTEDASIEIGYSIAREFWGKGYVGAAVRAVVEYLQNEPRIRGIRAWTHEDNAASRRVLLGAGFEECGRNGEKVIFVRKAVK